jgi:proline iminopeptidase
VPPVVFMHGGPGQGSYHFAALSGPALETSLRLVYFDQRGSGRSERPWTRDYSLPTLIDDIEALRRALGVPRIALVAHSFGSALALEYAAKYPERVSRMVIFDGISDVPASARSQCDRLAAVSPEAYARSAASGKAPVDPSECSVTRALSGRELTAFFRASMFPDSTAAARLDSVYAASGLRNTGELSATLFGTGGMGQWRFAAYERLTMPVLVIAGRRDYQVGLEPQRELARKLPNGRLLVYDESGHYPNLDEPARFARDVVGFLTEAPAGTNR